MGGNFLKKLQGQEKRKKKEKKKIKEIKKVKIPVEISARHVHLCKKDMKKLFGKSYELESIKTISQPGQFAARETVDLIYEKKRMHNIRILGPLRKASQAELSLTDAYKLSMDPLPKIKLSGNNFGSVKIKAEGPKGTVKIPCIIPKRHIHMPKKRAKELGIKNGQEFSVKVPGERSVTFDKVVVRVSDKSKTALHLDTDEGNAVGITTGKGDGKLLLEYEKEN